jgi:hypothetical protein
LICLVDVIRYLLAASPVPARLKNRATEAIVVAVDGLDIYFVLLTLVAGAHLLGYPLPDRDLHTGQMHEPADSAADMLSAACPPDRGLRAWRRWQFRRAPKAYEIAPDASLVVCASMLNRARIYANCDKTTPTQTPPARMPPPGAANQRQ